MYRKMMFFIAILVMFSLVMAPFNSVQAQDPQPPRTPIPTTFPHYPPQVNSGEYDNIQNGVIPSNSSGDAPSAVAAAVALGQSGLSYRYVKTFGKTEAPYLADAAHLNYPFGLGTDGNNVWIAELWGNRAIKYNNAGVFQRQIGFAGVTDVYDFQTCLGEMPDVAADSAGNTWVVDYACAHIAKFDSSGNLIGELGTLWEKGTDNNHFDIPMSIAFDASGNIYVSDGAPWWTWDIGNHRIQVFDSSGNYLATIGETGVTGSDNSHFHGPRHIATYGNELFVADSGNQRIQIFDITIPTSPVYLTTIGVSGEEGSDDAHFINPSGVSVDGGYIYVADSWNNRVQVFDRNARTYVTTIGTGWGTGNYQFKNPADVAVDSAGKLYVADFINTRVLQFNRSGNTWIFARKYGVTNVPYLTDGYHYNKPSGVAVAGDGSIYLTEESGHRLVKLNAAGVPLWTRGTAGVKGDWNDSNTHLNNPADVALDAVGRVYVADRWFGRVKIFNPNGSFFNEINNLGCPGGVTVAPNGLIYVADSCDQTVKIYDTNLSLLATLGISGEAGSDNAHFNWPEDVAVDSIGNIFVSDQTNQRIQVFDSNRVYMRTMGVNGESGEDFNHFWNPNGLFVDSSDRLFVADQDNNRIQIFDNSGAYLTTIAGSWGTNTGQLRAAMGVALDNAGNVYIADMAENHRIQKFSPGVPSWEQTNLNGFGNRFNRGITSLEVFKDLLYAGASNWEEGGSIWRSTDATTWTQVTEPGFGIAYGKTNPAIIDMVEFNDQLYAGVGWDESTGQLWRSTDGLAWEQVVGDGFGDTNNGSVAAMTVYNNMLYIGTGNSNNGPQIWRSSSGDISSWSNVVTNGLGCSGCSQVSSMIEFNSYLYAAVESNAPAGLQIWRTNNGGDWNQVGETGLGDNENNGPSGLAIFNGNMYVGTLNKVTGAQIWRSSDGLTWTKVIGNGFGDVNNSKVEALYTFGANLFAETNNSITGLKVWRSSDGVSWNQINQDGFGDSNNDATLWSSATTSFNNSFYIGTWNWNGNGGEIWNLLSPVVMNINTVVDTGDNTLSEGEQFIGPITQFAITFNKDINPPTVTNFSLKNGTTVIPINSVNYDSSTKIVTLNVNGGVRLPVGSYTLAIKSTVTATDGNSMATDFVRHFGIPKPLSASTLLLPANNSVITDYTPRLDWSTTVLAPGVSFDHYKLRVASDSGFHSIILDQDITSLANSEYTFPSDLNSNSTFYWYVQAYSTIGQVSGWSPIWSFRTALLPVTLNPLQNGNALRPTFSWTDPNTTPPATGYSIQIAAVSNFSTLLTSGTTTTGVTSYTPNINLPAGKTLYWRVRANGGNGPSLWATGSFTSSTPPSTATLLLPANSSLNTNYTPLFKWSAVTLPLGTTFQHYQLQVDDNVDFSSPVIDDTSITDRLTVQFQVGMPLAHNTRLYWRVLAFNNLGQYSTSAVWSFRTALTPPTLISPVTPYDALTLRPTFDWQDVSETGVTGYTIQISTSSSFATITNTGSPVTSTYTPAVDLPKNKLLYWRVQTKGTNGPSAWSEVRSFTSANAPTTPVLVAPALNALNTNYTPLFKWNTVTMPLMTTFKHYQLQVDDNNDFSSPVINDTSITNRLTVQFQVVTPLTHNTKFYWRVRAVNTDDETSNWSAVWYFRTALTPPTLVSPGNGFNASTLRPTFDWQDVSETGVTGYTIQISTSSSFATITNTGSPVTSTYTPAVDLPKNKLLYWRVQTKGTNGPSAWSEVRSFTSANAPTTPVLVAPALNALNTNYTPLFKWNTVTMPLMTTFKHYQLQVDDNNDFSSPVINDTSITNRLTVQFQVVTPLTHNTKFYWRVRAVNTDDETSNWSAVWYFRTAVDPTTLLTPANGITLGTLKPVFDWEDVSEAGVTGYTIQAAAAPTFATLLMNSTTVDSTYTRLTNLPAGKTLYWRVRVNGANGPSLWSTVFSFNTSAYHEAPSLAAKVAAGTLPAVEKRLPDTPVVTTADYAVIGKYGGILQTASWWPEVGNVQLYFAAEAPIKWNAQLTGYEPALVESFEWSADGRTFTMHMRKGLKWSDGKPYTSADWKYWWEDYALNPDQNIWTIPAYLRNADGTPINMTFPDNYTVVWTSKDRALYIDPYFMAQGYWEFAKNFMKPAHYLKQFNPKYYPTRTWENYAVVDQWWANPKFPCLFAWCLSALSSDGHNYTFSRNPYYWRVDADGNQLPYIDQIKVELVSDEWTRILNCAQGKYDTAFRICGGPIEIPYLTGNATAGGYHLLENYMNGAGTWPGYMVNQDYVEGGNNYADDTPEHAAEIRNLLRNHDFRVALSTGFDRQDVINAAWGGVGEAKNMTISPQSPHFSDPAGKAIFQQWAESYTTFNASAANALLDGLGMTKGADGFRRLPSGKPFTLVMDISDWGGILQVQVDAANEMKKQWETNLGIQVQINNLQGQPDVDTRTNEGYYMIRGAHVSELDVLTFPDWMFPVFNRYTFPLEGRWFAMGGDACTEQPTEGNMYPCGMKPENGSPAQILQGLYNQARETSTFEGRNAVVQDAAAEIIEDGPFIIGISGDRPMPVLIKNYMKNILDYGVIGPWAPATPGNQITALWWMDK